MIYNLKIIIYEMLTLCINTAGHTNTLAIVKKHELIAEENWLSERNETETILPKLESLLKKAEMKIQEIEALNVIQGIGGFTSLRVGISIANTIAYDLQIPIYGTSIFELWSKRINEKNCAILVDAGRQECFYFSIPFKGFKIQENQLSQHSPNKDSRIRKNDIYDFFKPHIIPNSQLSILKEKFWIGKINEKQKVLLSRNLQESTDLKTPGEAFAEIDLEDKRKYKILEPWYGREPNISKSKQKFF